LAEQVFNRSAARKNRLKRCSSHFPGWKTGGTDFQGISQTGKQAEQTISEIQNNDLLSGSRIVFLPARALRWTNCGTSCI
jgi:hypothetical protein